MMRPLGADHNSTSHAAILSVSPNEEDHGFLGRLFDGSDWYVPGKSECAFIRSSTLASACSVLRERPARVVLCERDLFPGTWRDMWEHISLLPDPPLLIVTSRLADDRLWLEALNLGAYDVLAKPFHAGEVIRVVTFAWQDWQNRRDVRAGRTNPRLAATGT